MPNTTWNSALQELRKYFPLNYYILKECLMLLYVREGKEFQRKNQISTHGSKEQCYLCVINVERKQPETDVDIISNSFVAKLRKKINIY